MGAGTAMMVGGSLLQGIGTAQSGFAQRGALMDQSRQAYMEGRESLRLSNYKVRLIQEAGAEMLGDVEAEAGKSGLAMTGTPLTHMVRTAREVELTAALQRRAGAVEKRRYDMQGRALYKAGKEAASAGKWGAASSFLGGAAKLFG